MHTCRQGAPRVSDTSEPEIVVGSSDWPPSPALLDADSSGEDDAEVRINSSRVHTHSFFAMNLG